MWNHTDSQRSKKGPNIYKVKKGRYVLGQSKTWEYSGQSPLSTQQNDI